MQPFCRLTALACPLPLANVDTDQIIPARFLKRSRADGYGDQLFFDLRHDRQGNPVAGFCLDDPRWRGAAVLVTRRNFGTGSSREAAVYALMDAGIRCVVAPSFGDIFAANAVNNGLCPARLGEAEAEAMLAAVAAEPGPMTVDLAELSIALGGQSWRFEIDPVWRTKLLNGWDDIDLTLSHAEAIRAFAQSDSARRPWATPARSPQIPSC